MESTITYAVIFTAVRVIEWYLWPSSYGYWTYLYIVCCFAIEMIINFIIYFDSYEIVLDAYFKYLFIPATNPNKAKNYEELRPYLAHIKSDTLLVVIFTLSKILTYRHFSLAYVLLLPLYLALPLFLVDVYPIILEKLASQSRLIFDSSDSIAGAEHSREYFSYGGCCYLACVFISISYAIDGLQKHQGILDPALQCTAFFLCAIYSLLLGAKRPQIQRAENLLFLGIFNLLIWKHSSWTQLLVLNIVLWGLLTNRNILKQYGAIFYLNYLIIGLEDSIYRMFIIWAFELNLRIQTDFSFVCAFYSVGLALLVLIRNPPHALVLYIHYWKTILITLGIVLLVVFLVRFEGVLESENTLLEKSQLIKSLVTRMLFFCSYMAIVLAFAIYVNRTFFESIGLQTKIAKEVTGDIQLSIIMLRTELGLEFPYDNLYRAKLNKLGVYVSYWGFFLLYLLFWDRYNWLVFILIVAIDKLFLEGVSQLHLAFRINMIFFTGKYVCKLLNHVLKSIITHFTSGIMKQLAVMLYLSLRGKFEEQIVEETGLFSPFLHSKHEKLSAKMAPNTLKETHGFEDLLFFTFVVGISFVFKIYTQKPSIKVRIRPWKRFLELIQDLMVMVFLGILFYGNFESEINYLVLTFILCE